MVFQSERAPLSRILPQLYLGAESDITQDSLSSRGISYVLSVSRCSPQPPFLPPSQYLRVPIDDSLRDDLLPWLPEALRFIDGAISLGCSVIVHCAAGISRSPALAVAYVMHSLEMDLDDAYRFVKQRRPTISPNFNFLGQLQLFQHTLRPDSADSQPPADTSASAPLLIPDSCSEPLLTGKEDVRRSGPTIQPEFTLSLSDKLRTLTLSTQTEPPSHTPTPTPQKPTHLHLPSLSDRRKSLTLSLTPAASAGQQGEPTPADTVRLSARSSPGAAQGEPEKDLERVPGGGTSARCCRPQRRRREERNERPKRRERGKRTATPHTHAACASAPRRQPGGECVCVPAEAAEATDGDETPASPLHLTINRLLGWGERTLLGLLLTPHIKLGHASLPYRC